MIKLEIGSLKIATLTLPNFQFSLYFMGFATETDIPTDESERTYWTFKQKVSKLLVMKVSCERGHLFHADPHSA